MGVGVKSSCRCRSSCKLGPPPTGVVPPAGVSSSCNRLLLPQGVVPPAGDVPPADCSPPVSGFGHVDQGLKRLPLALPKTWTWKVHFPLLNLSVAFASTPTAFASATMGLPPFSGIASILVTFARPVPVIARSRCATSSVAVGVGETPVGSGWALSFTLCRRGGCRRNRNRRRSRPSSVCLQGSASAFRSHRHESRRTERRRKCLGVNGSRLFSGIQKISGSFGLALSTASISLANTPFTS